MNSSFGKFPSALLRTLRKTRIMGENKEPDKKLLGTSFKTAVLSNLGNIY